MHVDRIETYAEFEKLRPNWEAVYRGDSYAQLFLSWTWLSHLFLRRPGRWFFILAARLDKTDDHYVAFFPMRLSLKTTKDGRAFRNEIYMAGNYWADYTGFVCQPAHEQQVARAFAEYLQGMHWAKLHLDYVYASAGRLDDFLAAFSAQQFVVRHSTRVAKEDNVDGLICPYVALPKDFDTYLTTQLSANTRQKLRRLLRKLDTSDDLRITHVSTATQQRDLEILGRFWKRKWAARKGEKVDDLAETYQQILYQALEADILFMPVLWRGEQPVCVLSCLIDRDKQSLLFFVAGRDERCRDLPSGLLLHGYTIRWAIENGFREYDFLSGNEPYKYSFGARERRLRCISVSTRSTRNLHDALDPRCLQAVLEKTGRARREGQLPLAQHGYQQILQQQPECAEARHGYAQLVADSATAADNPSGQSPDAQLGRRPGDALTEETPMATAAEIITDTGAALHWATAQLPGADVSLERSAPWVTLYTLAGAKRRARLRVVGSQQAHVVELVAGLSQHAPQLLPELISTDQTLGAMLFLDSGAARTRGLAADEDSAAALVSGYAGLQASARHQPALLSLLPELELATLVPKLLAFLDCPEAAAAHPPANSAAAYLGQEKSLDYHAVLSRRADLIGALLSQAAGLPKTLNHCDLRPDSITRDDAGQPQIDDWECALLGPAGLSIHALFDGCAVPIEMLSGPAEPQPGEPPDADESILQAYVQALAEAGYASRSELDDRLPGAFCAGAINAIVRHAEHPPGDDKQRKRVRRQLQARLSDLLDLCDELALQQRQTALSCARDYQENGRPRRAEDILRRYASMHRDDAEAHAELADLLRRHGEHEVAVLAYRKAIVLDPENATLHGQLGDLLMRDFSLPEARSSFELARTHGADDTQIEDRLARLDELHRYEEAAGLEASVPEVTLGAAELASGKWSSEMLSLAARLFRRYGVLLVRNAFDAELLASCNAYFLTRYADYLSGKTHSEALRIGDKRYQIGIALEGPLNDPGVYANRYVLALMSELLSDDFILGCTVCATSLPGAKDQHLHKDHKSLYSTDSTGRSVCLPPFAITTMVPLLTLDEQTGTTAVRKGSHMLSERDSEPLPEQLPLVPLGSCFLMDMRLSHRGLANRSRRIRPILNMVYQHAWFQDTKNFDKHPPLCVSPTEYERIPEPHRRLLDWGARRGPQINR